MLNEDELRDAILLVFANKQDLPVSLYHTELEIAISSQFKTLPLMIFPSLTMPLFYRTP